MSAILHFWSSAFEIWTWLMHMCGWVDGCGWVGVDVCNEYGSGCECWYLSMFVVITMLVVLGVLILVVAVDSDTVVGNSHGAVVVVVVMSSSFHKFTRPSGQWCTPLYSCDCGRHIIRTQTFTVRCLMTLNPTAVCRPIITFTRRTLVVKPS